MSAPIPSRRCSRSLKTREEEMVREAAEGLGGIATESALPVLRKWAAKDDAPRVVRESRVVAIDINVGGTLFF